MTFQRRELIGKQLEGKVIADRYTAVESVGNSRVLRPGTRI